MSGKKGFVLYFDSYRWIAALDSEQKGLLLDALFRYGTATAREDLDPAQFLCRLPDMERETAMAFCFMADSIYRDTRKWRQSLEQRRQRAAARGPYETRGPRLTGDPVSVDMMSVTPAAAAPGQFPCHP